MFPGNLLNRCIMVIFSVILCTIHVQGQYAINLTLKPYKNQYVYLGYHYGKIKALADSVKLDDQSTGVLKGTTRLPGGIYFIVSPAKEILFEVLIDKDQEFSIVAERDKLPKGIQFKGTKDNIDFQSYSELAAKSGLAIQTMQEQLKQGLNRDDSIGLVKKMRSLNDLMQLYRDSIARSHPNSFLAMLFKAMREPVVPKEPDQKAGRADSLFAYHYFKDHYWDGVDFSDERLVRTPFFEIKLDKYYRDLVVPNSDSLIKEIDAMLLQARTSSEMFKYLMVRFVQQYIQPQYMGQDAVFVHLFEKYINTGQATFFTQQYRDYIDKRAYSLMANLIGNPAADMDMVDSTGKRMRLYDLRSDYTVIVFWDPTCGHCKEVVPKVDSIFQAKWKAQGVKIYAVKVEGPDNEWQQFIKKNALDDWHHVYQLASTTDAINKAGKPGFRQLYDVYQTPVLYLLDKDKRIIAKKLDYLQMDDVLQLKIKNRS
jgi:hypothetical protein